MKHSNGILLLLASLACLMLLPACTDETQEQEEGQRQEQGPSILAGKQMKKITVLSYRNVDNRYTYGGRHEYTPQWDGNTLTSFILHDRYYAKAQTLTINYQGNNVTSISTASESSKETIVYFDYTDGRLTKILDLRNLRQYSLGYNTEDQLATVRQTLDHKICTYQLTWQDGNIVSMEETTRYNDGTTHTDTYTYTYDDQPSLFTGMSIIAYLEEMTEFSLSFFSKNNMIRCTNSDGTVDIRADLTTSDGYPVSLTLPDMQYHIQYPDAPDLTPETYTIQSTPNNSKLGHTYGQGVYLPGQRVIMDAEPATGSHFVRWSNGKLNNTLTFVASQDENFTALFEVNGPQQYTITARANNPAWGSVSGSGAYNEGSTATLRATAAPGYEFEYWTTPDSVSTRNPIDVTVNRNATYTANFFSTEGLRVTFGTTRWVAQDINAQLSASSLRIAAKENAGTNAPAFDLLLDWEGTPATGTFQGHSDVRMGESITFHGPRVWYYEHEQSFVFITNPDGSRDDAGDWWSKTATLNVTALDATALTVSFSVNAVMGRVIDVISGHPWQEATERSLVIKVNDLHLSRP